MGVRPCRMVGLGSKRTRWGVRGVLWPEGGAGEPGEPGGPGDRGGLIAPLCARAPGGLAAPFAAAPAAVGSCWCGCCLAVSSSPSEDPASSSNSRASASGSRVLAGSALPAWCCDLASAIVCWKLIASSLLCSQPRISGGFPSPADCVGRDAAGCGVLPARTGLLLRWSGPFVVFPRGGGVVSGARPRVCLTSWTCMLYAVCCMLYASGGSGVCHSATDPACAAWAAWGPWPARDPPPQATVTLGLRLLL